MNDIVDECHKCGMVINIFARVGNDESTILDTCVFIHSDEVLRLLLQIKFA